MMLIERMNINIDSLKSTISKYFDKLFYFFVIFLWLTKYYLIRSGVFYNPDEFEWLYIIEKCRVNCSIFDFDSHTTGPLAIWILRLLFYPFDDINVENLHKIRLIIEIVVTLIIGVSKFKMSLHRYVAISFFLLYISLPFNDLWAYNTEYLTLPFIAYLTFNIDKIGLKNTIVLVILILALPLIKIQTLPISLLFFIILSYRLITKEKQFKRFCVILFVLTLVIVLICVNNKEEINILYFNYIEKNVWYTQHFSKNTIVDAIGLMIQTFLHPLKIVVVLFVIIFCKFFFSEEKLFFFKSRQIRFSILLFLSSLSAVLIPRNDFLHYYMLIIIPLVSLAKFSLDKLEIKNGILMCLLVIQLFFSYKNVVSFNRSNDYWRKCDSILVNRTSTSVLNKNKYNSLDLFLLDLFYSKKNKIRLLVTGWFEAQVIYYRYRKISNFVFRSNITMPLSLLKGYYLEREVFHFLDDLNKDKLPEIIIITKTYNVSHPLFFELLKKYNRVKLANDEIVVYKLIK